MEQLHCIADDDVRPSAPLLLPLKQLGITAAAATAAAATG